MMDGSAANTKMAELAESCWVISAAIPISGHQFPGPHMPIMNDAGALLRSVVAVMNEQRHRERERVRADIKAARGPLPAALVDEIAKLPRQDARDVLRDHPGFPLCEKRKSYEISLRVFERSVEDLLRAIQDLEESSHDGTIFNRTREQELHKIQCGIQKELFATANAAHALVEHSRRVNKAFNVPCYQARRTECFGNDGLHEFVVGLRTLLHHLHMFPPGWQITRFSDADNSTMSTLDRDEVLLIIRRERDKSRSRKTFALAKQFLAQEPKTLDIKQMFEEYRRRVREFRTWFADAIEEQGPDALRDYERCLLENTRSATRTWWRARLENWLNWQQPPNPHEYLDRYLTPQQLKEVYRLPMGSKEQVDKVIEFVDTDSAFDDDLRHLAYELFRRATP